MGFHVTSRRMATKHPHALRAGASVSATLVEATGPNNHVTGARSTPTRSPDVLESRFAPSGTFTAPVKKRLWRWAMAHAGHSVNQTCCAGSPQPHVRLEAGWPDHTCHHRATAGTVNPAMTTRWKPMPRSARAIGLRGAGPRRCHPRTLGAAAASGGPSPSSARSASSGEPAWASRAWGVSTRPSRSSPQASVLRAPSTSTAQTERRTTARVAAPFIRSSCARHPQLRRRRRGSAGTVGGPGVGQTRVVRRGAGGGGRRRPRRRRVKGCGSYLPPRLPRAALRRDGALGARPLARPRARERATPAARDGSAHLR